MFGYDGHPAVAILLVVSDSLHTQRQVVPLFSYHNNLRNIGYHNMDMFK